LQQATEGVPIRFKIDKVPGHSAMAFQLLGDEGRPLLSSRRFRDRDAAVQGARVALHHMDDAEHYAVRQVDGGARVVLLDTTLRELARSRTFASLEQAEALRDHLIEEAADAEDHSIVATTTSRRRFLAQPLDPPTPDDTPTAPRHAYD
jgi:hypothetical protein